LSLTNRYAEYEDDVADGSIVTEILQLALVARLAGHPLLSANELAFVPSTTTLDIARLVAPTFVNCTVCAAETVFGVTCEKFSDVGDRTPKATGGFTAVAVSVRLTAPAELLAVTVVE
jgi:hypothetical protein